MVCPVFYFMIANPVSAPDTVQKAVRLFLENNISGTFICAFAAACTFFIINDCQIVDNVNSSGFALLLAGTASDTTRIAGILNSFAFVMR